MLVDPPRRRAPRSTASPTAPPPGHDDLVARIQAYPRRRTYLLPALIDVQHELRWLPPWAVEAIGLHLRVPRSEVYGVASSFPDLRLREPPSSVVRICQGASCRQLGAQQVAADAVAADCLFICGVGPAAEMDGTLRAARRPPLPPLPADTLIQDGACTRAVAQIPAAAQRVGCAGNCWQAPAWSDGRGGAYFPVGAKWETARNTPSAQKYLLVNAEEGEPGIYKDRHLLEGDPHRFLEGIFMAALAIGATDVVVFVNGEAHLARERLLSALERA